VTDQTPDVAPKKKAPRGPIEPPPPLEAQFLPPNWTAGLLGLRMSHFKWLRRTRADFPQAIKIPGAGGGVMIRFVRSEVLAWALAQPRGWSTNGGIRNLLRGQKRRNDQAGAR